jgi:GT2 family glycosyltransferase
MLSVIIPCYQRSEIGANLPHTLAMIESCPAEVLVITPVSSGELHQAVEGLPNHRALRVFGVPSAAFNKCVCLNLGALRAEGDVLLTLDTDTILRAESLQEMLGCISETTFVSIARIVESQPDRARQRPAPESHIASIAKTTEILCKDGRRASFEYRTGTDGSRCAPGVLMVRTDDLVAVQGFNSGLGGWGFEDYDFQLRLQFLLGRRRVTVGEATHMTHPAPHAATTTQGANNFNNMQRAFENYARGEFLGSLRQDAVRLSDHLVEVKRGELNRTARLERTAILKFCG